MHAGVKNAAKGEIIPKEILQTLPWSTKVEHHCKQPYNLNLWYHGAVELCQDGGFTELSMKQRADAADPCVVYDLGIRDRAEFALRFIERFGCTVRGYDPSPTTAKWWEASTYAASAGERLRRRGSAKTYKDVMKLHEYSKTGKYDLKLEAASDHDGNLTLYAYNWQQVSLYRASEDTKDKQEEFVVPAKTLPTMMAEHGDKFIDVLKVDIEGSEYAFLNNAFDQMGCPPVETMMLEWHNQEMDPVAGAPPQVAALEDRMYKCGYKKYLAYPFYGDSPTRQEDYDIPVTYYGLGMYCKTCVE